jgi:DNA polymerase zeta
MSDSIQHLSAMAIEVMAFPTNKNEGIANPETDPIQAIGIAICSNVTKNIEFCYEKIILVSDPNSPKNEKITFVENEAELFKVFVDIINKFDPDILIGYDLLRGSFAYLCDRATSLQNFDFLEQISRIKSELIILTNNIVASDARISKEHPVFIGRIKLELWRVVRRESPMRSYSLSSLVAILLKKPFPELQLHDLMRMNELNGKLR